MNAVVLSDVLRDPRVWQGPRHAQPAVEPTGHALLDDALPGGGLPVGSLVEVLHEFDGTNELTLLLPLIARVSRMQHRIVFVNPPYIPYAPAFVSAGVDPACMHTIQDCGDESLWAAEQALRSSTCALVACWPRQASDRQLRRLQLAAEGGRAIGVVFRPARMAMTTSPAAVRLRAGVRGIEVLKCRGGNARARSVPLSSVARC
ncbi:MAG: translesion DNA synthesis-associated protein ImuA [Proteobacteria bacterium]|nr:translesion DNA synthesis-associated protein ImuA [Pseudomonadota bacterium]